MKNIFQSFEFKNGIDFIYSLFPDVKYNIYILTIQWGLIISGIKMIFGISYTSLISLILIMILEISTGVYASKIKGEKFSSTKLSRFTVKAACYLILITIPYMIYNDFSKQGNDLIAEGFKWLHNFLIVQIVIENLISVLENIAVIQGKDKTHWILKIKEKFNL